MITQRARRHYADLAPVYDSAWRTYIEETTRRTAAALQIRGGERVLDVGCGTGALALFLRQSAPAVRAAGCDLSLEMLQVARSRLSYETPLVACNVVHLPFHDASFDIVASASSLHYWPDVKGALAEVARVLRPGGSFVLTDWSGDHLRLRLLGIWLRLREKVRVRSYRTRELTSLLEAAGFRVEKVERYGVGWFWRLVTVRATLATR